MCPLQSCIKPYGRRASDRFGSMLEMQNCSSRILNIPKVLKTKLKAVAKDGVKARIISMNIRSEMYRLFQCKDGSVKVNQTSGTFKTGKESTTKIVPTTWFPDMIFGG